MRLRLKIFCMCTVIIVNNILFPGIVYIYNAVVLIGLLITK